MELNNLSLQQIFTDNQEELQLKWLTATQDNQNIFSYQTLSQAVSAADLVGHLNLIHPNRIQILGNEEIAYYQNLEQDLRYKRWHEFLVLRPPLLVVADNLNTPIELEACCIENKIPLFISSMPSAIIIDNLRDYLTKIGAPKVIMHGVFMDIFGLGVFIIGESGLGKSELGLELITRGHGLVADDAVEFAFLGSNYIEGRCPILLQNLLEVRGIGLLDIKSIFGETSVRRKMKLKLVIKLIKRNNDLFERLPFETQYHNILGHNIRCVTVQIAAGRNMAVIVEAAVRNTILQIRGINTLQDFIQKQKAHIENNIGDNYLKWKDD